MEISEVSNTTLTVPNRFWQTFESAFTTPSPGTSNTFGATSILNHTANEKRQKLCSSFFRDKSLQNLHTDVDKPTEHDIDANL